MTDKEKAIVMAYTGRCMLTGDKFQIFHKYVEDIMGRPIWTDDIGWLEKEIKEKSKADFIALCKDESSDVGQWEWVPFGYPSILGNWVCSKCKCVAVEAVSKENKDKIPTYKYCPQCGQPKEVKNA